MALFEMRSEYENGRLGKREYNSRTYQVHRRLFEYPPFMQGTNVASIEITDAGVVFQLRDPNIKMWCTPGDERHTAVTSLNFRQYESQEFDAVIRIAGNCTTFIDIGANVGFYSLAVGQRYPDTSVFAFEPVPSTYNELARNITLNCLQNVSAFNVGLSDRSSEIPFYFDPTVSGATASAPLGSEFTTETIICRVESLDSFVNRQQIAPDLIKCDVEGAELHVFLGAKDTLERFKPVVFTEMLRKWAARFGYHPNEIILFFRQIGYECFVLSGGAMRPFTEMTEETVETNFFFFHPERHMDMVHSWSVGS